MVIHKFASPSAFIDALGGLQYDSHVKAHWAHLKLLEYRERSKAVLEFVESITKGKAT